MVIISDEFQILGGDFANVGIAATELKSSLKKIGIPSAITRRASIIAYEAEMNLVIHAFGGILRYSVYKDRINVIAMDEGPGIPDIEQAMEEGYSTASDEVRELGFGAGMGLCNIKRNSDNMEIKSEVGKGTVVDATIFISE